MGEVKALGYVRVSVTDVETWRAFAFGAIGFAEGSGQEPGALYLRMDERPGRIVLIPDSVDQVGAVGWEVCDGMALRRVRESLDRFGVQSRPLTANEVDLRAVEDGIAFIAPGGTPTEIFFGPALDHSPVATPFGARFVTGTLGLGHVVVPVVDVDNAFAFYTETLEFMPRGALRLAPLADMKPRRLRFLSPNRRHHSLAIVGRPEVPAPAMVHIMVEFETLDEVGQALDRVRDAGCHLTATLGRHTNDKMVSFYVRTPGGWDLEVGCHGLVVDDSYYTAEEITADSYWGHKWDFS